MTRRLIAGLLALLLVGAAPNLAPEELVRQGNAAFAREDYAAALDCYSRAEERITDPGLVACNKGAALYRLNRYDEAARHYEGCLEDATGGRRAAVLYDLGNCRLQQSRGSDAERLKQAVDCFVQCLKESGGGDRLHADARHNLELAKLLWVRTKQSPGKPEGSNPDTPRDPPKRPDDKQPAPSRTGPDAAPSPMGDPTPSSGAEVDPKTGQPKPVVTSKEPLPGKGDLPPIPDRAERTPMTPEDAAAHLHRAAGRVLGERRRHQQQSAPAPSRVIPDY